MTCQCIFFVEWEIHVQVTPLDRPLPPGERWGEGLPATSVSSISSHPLRIHAVRSLLGRPRLVFVRRYVRYFDEQIPCSEEQTRCSEEQTPCSEEQAPCFEEQTSCFEEQTRCSEEQTPCFEEQTSCSEEQNPCFEEQTSCSEE